MGHVWACIDPMPEKADANGDFQIRLDNTGAAPQKPNGLARKQVPESKYLYACRLAPDNGR
jgi:hypothetical protein